MRGFIYFLVFLSGLTGLVYQVTWQKYLSIFLGSHAVATAIVLSVFFLFLSLGYWYFGKNAHKLTKNKLLLYGQLELVIGIYALISPAIFPVLHEVFSFHTESKALAMFIEFLVSSLYIGLPTFLMGGTIPVLTLGLTSKFESGHRVHALIYGVNTLGAFAGTVWAGFYLIESLGLSETLHLTGVINIFLFILIFVYLRFQEDEFEGLAPSETEGSTPALEGSVRSILLTLSFFSGFYVFSLETLLIRMAGVSIGSSTYTFTIIVGAYIFAIGVGSLIISLFKKIVSLKFLVATQVLLFVSVLATYFAVPYWPELFLRIKVLINPSLINFYPYWGLVFSIFVLMLFIPVGLMGTGLPLLFNYIRSQKEHLSHAVGQLYSINCIGSTLGAAVGGYYLFNFMSGPQIYKLNLSLILLVLGLTVIWGLGNKKKSVYVLLISVLLPWAIPDWDDTRFTPNLYGQTDISKNETQFSRHIDQIKKARKDHEIIFTEYDTNTYVNVANIGDARALYVNSKPDAQTNSDNKTRALAALMPLTISPYEMENVFIIGLGAGLSTAIATLFDEVKHVEVAEISQGVIDSLPYFNTYNFDLASRADKFTLTAGDAYKVLKSKYSLISSRDDIKKYNLIICEPSNPWVAGVDKLFTKEFYEQAAKMLDEDGFYAQWFPLFQVDERTFSTILATFRSVFPWTTVWMAGGGSALTLLGSKKPPVLDMEKMKKRFGSPLAQLAYKNLRLERAEDILLNQLLTPFMVAGLSSKAEGLHTLENPILEYQAGKAFFANLNANSHAMVANLLLKPIDKELQSNKFLWEQVGDFSGRALEEKASLYAPEFYKFRMKYLQRQSSTPLAQYKLSADQKAIYSYIQQRDIRKAPQIKMNAQIVRDAIGYYNELKYSYKYANPLAVISLNPLGTCQSTICTKAKMETISSLGLGSPIEKEWARYMSAPQGDDAAKQVDGYYLRLAKFYAGKK